MRSNPQKTRPTGSGNVPVVRNPIPKHHKTPKSSYLKNSTITSADFHSSKGPSPEVPFVARIPSTELAGNYTTSSPCRKILNHLTVLRPALRYCERPRHKNTPGRPSGSVTVPETASPANARSRTTFPFGVGVTLRNDFKWAGCGATITFS